MREVGVSPEDAVAQATNHLALTQIMMANSITSLRDIGRRDWREFVEHQSAMDAVLREDPAGFYSLMTFATRDAYRHVVERIAKRTVHSEVSVAGRAIEMARRHAVADGALSLQPPDAAAVRQQHVGYYLIDDGLVDLERATGYSPRLRERVERGARRAPNLVFAGGLILCMMMTTLVVMLVVGPVGRAVPWLILAFAFLPVLDVALSVLNHLVTTACHRACCRDWICTNTACRPSTVPWSSCPRCSAASRMYAPLWRISRCSSWRIVRTTCNSPS